MNAPGFQNQSKFRVASQQIMKFKEDSKMELAKQMRKITTWISNGLTTQHPFMLVGAVALGALLMAGTALHFAPPSAEPAGKVSSISSGEVNPFEEIDAATEDVLDELADLHFGLIKTEVMVSTLPAVDPFEEMDVAMEDLLDELADLHFGPIKTAVEGSTLPAVDPFEEMDVAMEDVLDELVALHFGSPYPEVVVGTQP